MIAANKKVTAANKKVNVANKKVIAANKKVIVANKKVNAANKKVNAANKKSKKKVACALSRTPRFHWSARHFPRIFSLAPFANSWKKRKACFVRVVVPDSSLMRDFAKFAG